jgi:predicted TIM-barrel fold metal-dependent hydrolase
MTSTASNASSSDGSRARRYTMPDMACDAHVHVFGAAARYPGAASRQYEPVERSLADYRTMANALGLQRLVLVQPSAYGTDNRCQLGALRANSAQTRAVVVVGSETTDRDLDAMHTLGVRGVRANLMNPRVRDERMARQILEPLAARVRRLGWHLQVYADAGLLASVAPVLTDLGVPVVLDHLAGVRRCDRLAAPEVQTLLALLSRGVCWVKLSGADIVADFHADIDVAAPFMRAMLAAAPDRVVWGSDWPHLVHFHGATGHAAPSAQFRAVDEADLLDLLAAVVPDESAWRKILVHNPGRLYDFPSVPSGLAPAGHS